MWAGSDKRKLGPDDPALKFGLGLMQVGAGFFVLVWGAQFADDSFRVPLIFLVLLYLLHTTGELFLSPVGLSQMTKLSPARRRLDHDGDVVPGLVAGAQYAAAA